MTPAQRKKNDQLAKFGKDVLYPAATFAIPALKGAKVASAIAGRKVVVAKAASAAKKATKPGAISRGANKLNDRAANSILDPSKKFHIDRRTAARYDLNYNLVKGGRKPLVAKEAVKKATKRLKNSPMAEDIRNRNIKNLKKKIKE